jgi:predicted O-linked N-acetylglucosamine transferase (SPINDLY family)
MAALAQVFQQALSYHQAGNLERARELYCTVLQQESGHADAWHLLGMVLHQAKQHDMAIECVGRALKIQGRNPNYHANLGAVLRGAGKLPAAEQSYRQALMLRPGDADSLSNLAVVLMEQDRYAEARKSLSEAIARTPGHLLALVNLGNWYRHEGSQQEAIACYGKVLRLQPNHFEALSNLGNALADKAQFAEAETALLQALSLQPESVEVLVNLGTLYRQTRRLAKAEAILQKALAIQPDLPPAHNNLGTVYRDQGLLVEAEQCYLQALANGPGHAPALQNLGELLAQQGRVAEAITYLRKSIEAKPDCAAGHSTYLVILNYDPEIAPETVVAEHRMWGERHGRAPAPACYPNSKDPDRRLRIGYVSPDFRDHAVARFIEPVITHHDASQAEVFCYAEVPIPDATTERLQTRAHGWRSTVGQSDNQVAEQIRADTIDILVDLAGHTSGNRLLAFARKPAPIQATYLGYPNTTGLATIDYLITDAVLNPPHERNLLCEEPVRLPCGFGCFWLKDTPELVPPPALNSGHITLGSLHRLDKLNPFVFDLWCRALEAVPGSRLLIYRHTLRGAVRDSIQQQFVSRGIDPRRLTLSEGVPGKHLEAYGQVDVALDVFPWSGGTISCEALWMGVPTPTLVGAPRASRLTATALASMGLSEWIAYTPDNYVSLVAEVCGDIDKLVNFRRSCRDRMRATIGDAERFCRSLEAAYRTMWRRWCEKGGS